MLPLPWRADRMVTSGGFRLSGQDEKACTVCHSEPSCVLTTG